MADREGPDHDVPADLADLYVSVWSDLAARLDRPPTGAEVDAEIAAAREAGML